MIATAAVLRSLTPARPELPAGLTPEHCLERGEILCFAPGALPLPPEEDLDFLRGELGRRITLKNVSYHPEGDYLSGIRGDRAAKERTRRILRSYGESVAHLLSGLCPRYAASWLAGKVNFRPFEEEGRDLPPHSSNELVHVDAFASGATHGGRILRFFTNIHPRKPRVWRSAGTLAELLPAFAGKAGLEGLGLRERWPDRVLSGLVRLCASVGLPQAAVLDSSPYDRAMKRLHDALKDDRAFQACAARAPTFEFPPFSSWVVLTDTVSHAAVRGQHALVATWIVPLASCVAPELAPYRLLARSDPQPFEM
jgi:hypothetical protein